MLRAFTGWSVVLFLSTTALAQAPKNPSGYDILKIAQDAAKSVTSIYYEGKLAGEGESASRLPVIEGRVSAKRTSNGPQIFMEGTKTVPGTAVPQKIVEPEVTAFKYLTDGVSASATYDVQKTYFSGKAEYAKTLEFNALAPLKFLGNEAYTEEMHAIGVEYIGMERAGGVECHVVKVNYDNQGRQSAKLFICKDDFLARRIERPLRIASSSTDPFPNTMLVFSVEKLRINPSIDSAVFSLDCPSGFDKQPFVDAATVTPKPMGPFGVGWDAPDWTLKDGDGKEVSLKSLRGNVVVLDFWATWCGPCKMAMPSIQKLHEKFKDKPVRVYGVNCWEKVAGSGPMDYVKKMKFTYGQLLEGTTVANNYQVHGIPTIVAIDKKGKIISLTRGFDSNLEQSLITVIEKELQNK